MSEKVPASGILKKHPLLYFFLDPLFRLLARVLPVLFVYAFCVPFLITYRIDLFDWRLSKPLFFLFSCIVLVIFSSLDFFGKACKSTFFLFLKNLVPCELLLTVFCMQKHFAACVSALLLAAILYAVCRVILTRQARREPGSFHLKNACLRAFVLVFCASLLVPSVIGAVNAMAPRSVKSDLAPDTVGTRGEEDGGYVRLLEGYGEQLRLLAPGTWETLGAKERMEVAQAIVNVESTFLTVTPVPVVAENLEENVSAQYSSAAKTITVDSGYLLSASSDQFIATLAHEVRHHYQRSVVDMLDWDSETVNTSHYFSDARAWRENFRSYVPGRVDYESYRTQEVEEDARSYAEWRTTVYELFLIFSDFGLT